MQEARKELPKSPMQRLMNSQTIVTANGMFSCLKPILPMKGWSQLDASGFPELLINMFVFSCTF
jgi:hypothetical protein